MPGALSIKIEPDDANPDLYTVQANRRAEKKWALFVERAHPTPEQTQALFRIFADAQETMARRVPVSMDERAEMSAREWRDITLSLREAIDDEVFDRAKAVLSDEQFAQFKPWFRRPYIFILGNPIQVSLM